MFANSMISRTQRGCADGHSRGGYGRVVTRSHSGTLSVVTIEEIRELIALANESGIAELEVQRGDNRVRIRRSSFTPPQEIVVAAPPAAVPIVSSSVSAPAAIQAPAPAAGPAAKATSPAGPKSLSWFQSFRFFEE